MSGNDSTACSYLNSCISTCADGAGKFSLSCAALAKFELVRIDGRIQDVDVAHALIDDLTEIGDLRSLFALNEEGVEGAADAYNEVREENVFSDLFEPDNNVDGKSSAGGSRHGASQVPSVSRFVMDFDNDQGTDSADESNLEQDLKDSFFVGREVELRMLEEIIVALKSAEEKDRVQHVSIVGGAGIGKSSFLDEINVICVREEVQVFRGHCRANEDQTSYFAFREVFSTLFGINNSGSINDKTEALKSRIKGNGFWRTIPHVALLKSVLAVDLVETRATKKMFGQTKAEAT